MSSNRLTARAVVEKRRVAAYVVAACVTAVLGGPLTVIALGLVEEPAGTPEFGTYSRERAGIAAALALAAFVFAVLSSCQAAGLSKVISAQSVGEGLWVVVVHGLPRRVLVTTDPVAAVMLRDSWHFRNPFGWSSAFVCQVDTLDGVRKAIVAAPELRWSSE